MPHGSHDTHGLAETIRAHVERLCSEGDRDLGTDRNRSATAYVAETMRQSGLEVEELLFDVPEWRFGEAELIVDGRTYRAHPGPFSASVDADGPLVVVRDAAGLDGLDASGAVLLLHGEIAHVQITPRGYPFYQDPAHAAILDALEATGAAAVVAATGKNPSMTAGMSPFPLIEEPGFSLPTAYLRAEEGVALAAHAGRPVRVTIDSQAVASTGVQPVGTRAVARAKRVVVGAHVDSKPGTPGALDNASGVAVMLAAAGLLGERAHAAGVEFVPFNGEDHVLAPGELAYLDARDLSDVALMINVDGAGLRGSPSSYSHYNADASLVALLDELATGEPAVVRGEAWPASDHMIFAMRGIPCIAITSEDFATASGVYSHTPADTPDVLDYEILAATARFVAAVVEAVSERA